MISIVFLIIYIDLYSMFINYDNNQHLVKFFYQHKPYEMAIRDDIEKRLPCLIAAKSPKIKLAKPLEFKGNKIYEYKIIVDKLFTCRVAYIYQNQTITVIFISETIIKYQFCQLLANTELAFRK